MTTIPGSQSSYWLETAKPLNLPSLSKELQVDIAIVGGGIAGLTAAYKLKKAGFTVAVIEKNTIGSGTTAGTTGKVTTQHGLIYAELSKQFGDKFTKKYADMSQKAFIDIRSLIADEKINCDWHNSDNFVYTTDNKKVEILKQEAAIAAKMGLPATFETISSLPIEIKGAVKFSNQAYFNAVKYVRSLAKIVNSGGCYVFENSEANKIHEGENCTVKTIYGKITSKHLVIATKVPPAPLIGRMTYAANEYPVTSYIVAAKYEGDLSGMYISPDKSHYSLLPVDTPEGKLLLIGGESHIPAIKRPKPNHKKLAKYAEQQFGISEVLYRWKAMDYIAYDSLPIVGKLYPWSKRTYSVGGFKKWGLNLSMVTANLLVDAISGKDKGGIEIFSPHRLSAPSSIPKAVIKYFA